MQKLIGVISDTHGLMRPEAIDALRGVEMILHAGDIGGPHVIEALEEIAPVVAIRGNNDRDGWADAFKDVEKIEVGEVSIHIVHDLKELAVDPVAEGIRVVIAGHSHKPKIEEKDGVLYLNPGSAGRRRFKLPITVAHLRIDGKAVDAEIVSLDGALHERENT